MLSFSATPVLLLAAAVWLPWRLRIWVRRRPDPVREVVVVALLLYVLALVAVTFFPLRIIFYDWSARFSLVPLASILQLVRETPPQVALRNIGGNLLLLLPLGVLLPLLFERLRRPAPLVARIAVVSVTIELGQLLTRARSVDVDDVLLNVLGGLLGWGVFTCVATLAARWRVAAGVLRRTAHDTDREPLLTGVLPIGVTASLAAVVMLTSVIGATIGDGPDLGADATDGWATGEVVARTDVGGDTFVLVTDRADETERLRLVSYNEVLPGRFAREAAGDGPLTSGPRHRWAVTPFNTAKGELPTVYVWGRAAPGVTTVMVTGNGIDASFGVGGDGYFVVGATFDPSTADGLDVLPPFDVRFLATDGTDLSTRVPVEGV